MRHISHTYESFWLFREWCVTESLPVLREEAEEAVHSLKAGKSTGVDNIPSELVKNGGEATTTVLTVICKKILETREWPKEWTQSVVIPLPKKGNLMLGPNYRAIRLISHPSKIVLQVSDSRPRLRNCWQKNKQVLDQAGAQQTRSS